MSSKTAACKTRKKGQYHM